MSHDSEAREEAKEFLSAFLAGLQDLRSANMTLAAVNAQLVQQQQVMVNQMGMLSAQLDGVAQRADLLDQQLGILSSVLSDGCQAQRPEVAMPPGLPPVGQAVNGFRPSFGEALGGVVGLGLDQLIQRDGGRRRRRR